MLPQISRKDKSDHVLLGMPTSGNLSHESQSTREPSQSFYFAADENIETLSSNKSGDSKETPLNQIQHSRNRKRVQAFVQSPSKVRRTNSYRQTTLCVELPSKYEIPEESLLVPEPQKSCFVSLSNSKMPGSIVVSKKKTPHKEASNVKTMNTRTSQSRLSQIQSQERTNLGKSYSIDKKKRGLSVYSQLSTKSLDQSALSHISSGAEGDLSIGKASNLKRYHKPSHRSLSSSSNSEDCLTSSTPVGHFHLKAHNSPQKSAISPTLPPINQSVSQHKQKNLFISTIKNSTIKDPASSKSYQQVKNNPILIDLLSSPDIEQPLETTETTSKLHLRPRKSKTKSLGIKKSRKQNARIYKDVPVPDPIYHPFKCEWEGCRAELMNMEILRKHVYAAHGKKYEDGGRRCLWGKCGLAWKDTCIEKIPNASSSANGPVINSSLIYLKRRDWKKHMEEIHLIPFSWHMGDGPCGSRLARPSTVWQQPYLFFADGRQTTPSVASQSIETGAVQKLNASRFQWQQGGPFGSEILVPISQPQRPVSLLSNLIASGSHDAMDENEGDQEQIDELNQIAEIRDVNTKKRRKDEDEFIPSDF
ncbi:putative c2h2 finger domain-containing protein [Erysiphe neolycopersici]|uniref:Putative c2h2 finger domain-containing protein n=1 Tax=Erysiphe neolycopersici TaxID=212602 RepID=A0A420HY18_9PEZI|nr:putative c2h2 finger domain-containing protein [Erysiphe neolycopersici]